MFAGQKQNIGYLLPDEVEKYQTSDPEVSSNKVNAAVGVDRYVGVNDINDCAVHHNAE